MHAVLLTDGKPCPVSDLFGVRGRQPLARLDLPEPWQGTIDTSVRLIDELDREISDCEAELRRLGADHRYVPLLCTVPGISWVLASTIAAELGDIARSPPRASSPATAACSRASTNQASVIKVLAAIAGFAIGGAIVSGAAIAVDQSRNSVAAMPMAANSMMTTMSASSAPTKLRIQHVQKS